MSFCENISRIQSSKDTNFHANRFIDKISSYTDQRHLTAREHFNYPITIKDKLQMDYNKIFFNLNNK